MILHFKQKEVKVIIGDQTVDAIVHEKKLFKNTDLVAFAHGWALIDNVDRKAHVVEEPFVAIHHLGIRPDMGDRNFIREYNDFVGKRGYVAGLQLLEDYRFRKLLNHLMAKIDGATQDSYEHYARDIRKHSSQKVTVAMYLWSLVAPGIQRFNDYKDIPFSFRTKIEHVQIRHLTRRYLDFFYMNGYDDIAVRKDLFSRALVGALNTNIFGLGRVIEDDPQGEHRAL